MHKNIKVDKRRLLQRLDQLAKIGALDGGGDVPPSFDGDVPPLFGGDAPPLFGGVSRLALSEADRQARDLTVSWMRTLGLTIYIDRVGNIIGLRAGEEELPPVMLGSHIDTVTVAGRYDGCFGVMAALEVVNTLNENHVATRRPLAVTVFTNEEGVRYTPGMLGSAAYAGKLSVAEVRALRGFDGSAFGEELERINYAGSLDPGAIRPYAFLELHIEQGPILAQTNVPIGVVDTVTGITWLEVTVTGAANHAGTTPIDLRQDAGLAAAKLIESLREIAVSIGGNQRATCGMIAFEPNAINVIPGKAVFSVDLRNSDGEALIRAEEGLYARAKEIEASDGVRISIHAFEHILPVQFDPLVVETIEQTAEELGFPNRRMVSGAGHDAQLMAEVCPTAMIFIPSCEGISHSPKEYSSPEDLERGANVLLHTALKMVNQKG